MIRRPNPPFENPPPVGLPFPALIETDRSDGARYTKRLAKNIERALVPPGAAGDDERFFWVEDIFDVEAMPERSDLAGVTVGQLLEETWAYQQKTQSGRGTASNVLGNASTQQLWQHARWLAWGSRCYDLSAALAAVFVETEMNVDGSDIQLPLPSFYLRVRDLGLVVNDIGTGDHVLDGFYISESDIPDGFTVSGERTKAQRAVSILACGLAHEGSEVTDNALAAFMVLLHEGNVETWVNKMADSQNARRGLDANAVHLVKWVRIIFGFCLYMLSENPDAQRHKLLNRSPEEAEELRKKAKRLRERGKDKEAKKLIADASLPVHYVKIGHNIEADANLEQHAAADEETRRMTKKFVVRGHYRNQAYGPGFTQRRQVLIKAYWKGPPWGEVVAVGRGARRHVVENPYREDLVPNGDLIDFQERAPRLREARAAHPLVRKARDFIRDTSRRQREVLADPNRIDEFGRNFEHMTMYDVKAMFRAAAKTGELDDVPVLAVGQADDLVFEHIDRSPRKRVGSFRIWRSRVGAEPSITMEVLVDGRWLTEEPD